MDFQPTFDDIFVIITSLVIIQMIPIPFFGVIRLFKFGFCKTGCLELAL